MMVSRRFVRSSQLVIDPASKREISKIKIVITSFTGFMVFSYLEYNWTIFHPDLHRVIYV
jgi:hypothetical protein